MNPPPAFALMAQQLAAAAAAMERDREDVRPSRPNVNKGRLIYGSVTYRVYRELLGAYPHTLQAWQLRTYCRAGRGAVAWAVRFLHEAGRIECLPDDGRHLHYLRYRARL